MNLSELKAGAEQRGIALRTLADVKADLEMAKRTDTDAAMARLMLKFGRLTDEARAFVEAWK